MAEDAPTTEAPAQAEATSEFQPITSQDDLNKIISDRVKRERAKFGDYNDVKAKAARLDEIEQASQTELERANKRAEEAEARARAVELSLSRSRIAAEKGIADWSDFITGDNEDDMAAAADLIASRLATAASPRQPRPDLNQGRPESAHALNSDGLEAALRTKLGI